jgi:hypothetical protein
MDVNPCCDLFGGSLCDHGGVRYSVIVSIFVFRSKLAEAKTNQCFAVSIMQERDESST